jgi:hypothetical protein
VTVCEEHAVAVALSMNGEATDAPPAGLAIAVSVVLADGVDGLELVVGGVSFADPQPANEKTIATKRNFDNFIRYSAPSLLPNACSLNENYSLKQDEWQHDRSACSGGLDFKVSLVLGHYKQNPCNESCKKRERKGAGSDRTRPAVRRRIAAEMRGL